MRDNPEGGDPAEGVRRHCMKNSPSVLSCIDIRGQEKAVTVASKSRQFTAGQTGKGQFLRGNRKNLVKRVL